MLTFFLPGPPPKLGTNHRRRMHWADINDLTERVKLICTQKIREQIPKDLKIEEGVPCFDYVRVTFTLVAPNFKIADPDNMSGMMKPILDCITVREGRIPLILDDKAQYVEVLYQGRKGTDKKRKPWVLMTVEPLETPGELSMSPSGIGNNMVW